MKRVEINPGDIFTDLEVLYELPIQYYPNGQKFRKFKCRCKCNKEIDVSLGHLRSGHTTKCMECAHKTKAKENRNTPEYTVWAALKARCTNPNSPQWNDYGGRGITVCDRWLNSFDAFLTDMGFRPSADHSIDRKDNNGPYSPNNCRWATKEEQSRNTRRTHLIEYQGETKCLTDWAIQFNLSPKCLSYRLANGWDFEKAIKVPDGYGNRRIIEYKGEFLSLEQLAERFDINIRTLQDRIYKKKWDIEKSLTTPVRLRKAS